MNSIYNHVFVLLELHVNSSMVFPWPINCLNFGKCIKWCTLQEFLCNEMTLNMFTTWCCCCWYASGRICWCCWSKACRLDGRLGGLLCCICEFCSCLLLGRSVSWAKRLLPPVLVCNSSACLWLGNKGFGFWNLGKSFALFFWFLVLP